MSAPDDLTPTTAAAPTDAASGPVIALWGTPDPTSRALLRALPREIEAHVNSPRWSFVKRDDDGAPALRSPLPSPFNYGHCPGRRSGDGDLLDVIVVGPRVRMGSTLVLPVRAVIDFVDEGTADPKVVVSARPLDAGDLRALRAFFAAYPWFKRTRAQLRGRSTDTRCRGAVARAFDY